MAPRRLVSQLAISSKWLPNIFIYIFKEYLKAKLRGLYVASIVTGLFKEAVLLPRWLNETVELKINNCF